MTKLILFSFLTLLSARGFAGDKVLNGGDICENRFQLIRDDLRSWIEKAGAQGLRLAGISRSQYDLEMLKVISTAQINCTDDKIYVGTDWSRPY